MKVEARFYTAWKYSFSYLREDVPENLILSHGYIFFTRTVGRFITKVKHSISSSHKPVVRLGRLKNKVVAV